MSLTCVFKSCVWDMVSVALELSVEVFVVTEARESQAVQVRKESDVGYIFFYVGQAYEEILQPLLHSLCEKRLNL